MSNVCPSLKFIKVGLASNVIEKEEVLSDGSRGCSGRSLESPSSHPFLIFYENEII